MKRLTKGNDELIAGVCSGIAEYLEIDPTLVRIAWFCLIFVHGIGIIPYIIFALLMPNKY